MPKTHKKSFLSTHVDNITANAALSNAVANAHNTAGGYVGSGQATPVSLPWQTYTTTNTGGLLPGGSITPGTINQIQQQVYKTYSNPLDNLYGLARKKVEEYLILRGAEAMRGRYEKNFLTEILGLTIEELKMDWFMIKEGDELTKDMTLCSKIHGKYIPLMHRCNKNGKFYSKTSTDMANSKIWCDHCEKELPEDLFTMLGIAHVM